MSLTYEEMENILLQEIENSFDETSNEFTTIINMKGYNNVYNFFCFKLKKGDSKGDKLEKFTYVFSKATCKKARKYNNLNTNDKTTYTLETNRMLKMCLYLKKYYEDDPFLDIKDILDNIITESWNKSEKIKHLHLIGFIINKNNLPSLVLGRKIVSFLYNLDEFKPLIFNST